MQVQFKDFSNLEESDIDLSRAIDLLSLILELFNESTEMTSYAQRYEAVVISAMNLIEKGQNTVKEVFDALISKRDTVA